MKNKSGKEKLTFIHNISKNIKQCQKCNNNTSTLNAFIKPYFDDLVVIDAYFYISEKKFVQRLRPGFVHDILKKISDDDCTFLGMNPKTFRPENMIHKPVCRTCGSNSLDHGYRVYAEHQCNDSV